LTASFAVFGRRASSSAFHCATDARYSSLPPGVAALRRSSLEIVDGERSSRLAISRTPVPCARSNAISSRSSKHKYRHETGSSMNVAMPPRSLNHRPPTACETPTACAASSLLKPSAIRRQNARSTSRRCDGLPGDFIGERPVNSFIHPAGLPITTSSIEVLRRPVESAQCAVVLVICAPVRPIEPERGCTLARGLRRLGALDQAKGRSATHWPKRIPTPSIESLDRRAEHASVWMHVDRCRLDRLMPEQRLNQAALDAGVD